jgi:hypothetical protein
MAEMIQFCLPNKAPMNSGRGVRFVLLDPMERNHVLLSAATLAGDDKAKLTLLRQLEGVKRMLRAVTKKKGLTDAELVTLPETEWMPVTQQSLESDYATLFTAKDDEILSYFYRDYHEPSQKEVNDIAGKVRTVSTD